MSARRLATLALGDGPQARRAIEHVEREIEALSRAPSADAIRALFMASELRHGVPLPATVMILEPPGLRISPAFGTGARAVADALRHALLDAPVSGASELVELDLGDFLALRTTRIDSHAWDERPGSAEFGASAASLARGLTQRHLRVDYWCTAPGTKHVLVVACWTSLGDIAASMLRLFDSIIRAAYYAPSAGIRHAAPAGQPR